MTNDNYILNISSSSIPSRMATIIKTKFQSEYNEYGDDALIEIQAIGAGAVNQALKSIIIARNFLAQIDLNIICVPAFGNFITKNGDKVNGIRLILRLEGK